MTITTAKLARAIRLAYAGPVTLAALLLAPTARAVDLEGVRQTLSGLELAKPSANRWRFEPTIELRQIYTDNVNLQPEGRAHGQFLTDIAPGLRVKHKGPRLVLDGQFQQHLYLNTKKELGTRRSSNSLRASAKAELLDDMVFLDASASMFQTGVSPFGPLAADNDYASANRANVKTWQLSPYLVNRFGRLANSELRYRHDSVDAGGSGLGSTEGDTLSYRLTSGTAWNDLGWGLKLSDQTIDDKVRNDSHIRSGSVDLSYQLRPTLGVTGAFVYDDYDYEALGGANGGNGWSGGLRWTPSRRTSVQASVGRRYYGPSRSLNALHRTRRTVWSVVYDDSVVTTRANFLLPETVIPGTGPGLPGIPGGGPVGADLGGGLLTGDIPVTDRPVVLPPSLTNNINFFSNRFSLQKQLRASVSFRGGRSAAVYSLFKVRREALSVRSADDALLGTPLDTLNDNIDQVGMNASLTYKLSPRTNLNLSGEVADNESLTTSFKARSNAVRLNLRHSLGRNLLGTVELRRVRGITGSIPSSVYTENAVSATLSLKL